MLAGANRWNSFAASLDLLAEYVRARNNVHIAQVTQEQLSGDSSEAVFDLNSLFTSISHSGKLVEQRL
jgi:hypothetical protein